MAGTLLAGCCRPQAGRGNVAALQVALRALGYRPMAIDGISGPWTRRAVRRFQRRKHLAVDGIAGPKTLRKLGRRGRPRYGRRDMHRGQRGFDVAALQFVLRRRGFHPGGIDGGFGRNTARAVKRFQRAVGLHADGSSGRATRRRSRRRVVFAPTRRRARSASSARCARRSPAASAAAGAGCTPASTSARATGAGSAPRAGAGSRFAGWNSGGYGYLVVVDHRLGFESWYAHLSRISVYRGQRVVGGTTIGRVGSTGHAFGPHLHFEVRRFGTPIDPRPRLLRAAAAAQADRPNVEPRADCAPNADVRNSAARRRPARQCRAGSSR